MEIIGKLIEATPVETVETQNGPTTKMTLVVQQVGFGNEVLACDVFGSQRVEEIKSRLADGKLKIDGVINVKADIRSRKSKEGKWFTSVVVFSVL